MNVQLPVRMDQQAFLAWLQGREERYELDRGRVIMLTGGSREHWQITLNLAKALSARLDADRYMVLPEFGIDLGSSSMRFPDIVVDAAGGYTRGDLMATAPVLIAEVLSPSSERIDLGDKAAEYLRLPTLLVYVVFAQDQMKAWVWLRGAQDFAPSPDVVEGEGARLQIASLGIDVPFVEIYDRVRLG
jgi:Uma2 family endonuclease